MSKTQQGKSEQIYYSVSYSGSEWICNWIEVPEIVYFMKLKSSEGRKSTRKPISCQMQKKKKKMVPETVHKVKT